MNGKKGRIGAFQLFAAAFVSRTVALVTFVIEKSADFPPGDRPLVFLPFFLFGMLGAAPMLLVTGKNGDRTLLSLADGLSPGFRRVLGALYAGAALWNAALGIARFDLFMGEVMFPEAKIFWLAALLAAAAVTAACRGTEAVARGSVAVLCLTAASILYVCLTTVGNFDVANLEPPLQNGLLPLAAAGAAGAARTGELLALGVLAPRVSGSVKKAATAGLLSFGLTVSAVYALISGVTGAYGERQTFQLYALSTLAKLGVFERLDALICAVWVLCTLLRTAFFLLIGESYFAEGFGAKRTGSFLLPGAAVTLAVAALLPNGENGLPASAAALPGTVVFLVFLVALPLGVWTAYTVKTKRKGAAV